MTLRSRFENISALIVLSRPRTHSAASTTPLGPAAIPRYGLLTMYGFVMKAFLVMSTINSLSLLTDWLVAGNRCVEYHGMVGGNWEGTVIGGK
jgi:hypothetical protein